MKALIVFFAGVNFAVCSLQIAIGRFQLAMLPWFALGACTVFILKEMENEKK